MNGYNPENKTGYRYVLVVIDNFSKYGGTVPLKNKNAQAITNSFESILITSKSKPNLIETDRGKEFYNSMFKNFPITNNIKHFSSNTSLGAFFRERFNRTITDLPKRLVSEKGDGNWIGVLPTITKQYNNRKHSSTRLSPNQASLKKNECYVYQNLLDKWRKLKPSNKLSRQNSRFKENFFKI